MQHRYEMCYVKSDKSCAYNMDIWRDFSLFGPPHILMSGRLAKCNFEAAAKSVGKYHNQTLIISSPHLRASQDLPTTAIDLRAKNFLS